MTAQLIVFSDLDGTLLDHHSYSWQEALPALEKLDDLHIPLILNSSKTASEISRLRREMDNEHPYVVENGAAVLVPAGYFPGQPSAHTEYFGPQRCVILGALARLRKDCGYRFEGFADMTPARLAEVTGLSPDDAIHAGQRAASEPLLWQDSEAQWQRFSADIGKTGLTLTRGGRFVHVAGQTDKGKALVWLMRRYRDRFPGSRLKSVALGDSANDIAMLEQADIAVLISNADGSGIELPDLPAVVRPQKPGPAGWRLAIEHILTEEMKQES